MGPEGWTKTTIDEVETLHDDLPAWKPLRHALGLEAFGVNAWLGDAGDEVIDDHDETGEDGDQEELYLVVSGRARFTVDGSTVDAPAGTLVAVRDPVLRRAAVASEDGTVVLAVGGVRGRAFELSGWEQHRIAKLR
jgi:uncharacterized cupin superfamily protein